MKAKTDSVGSRIKFIRKQLNLTQKELGDLCGGVSKSAVSQWERELTIPDFGALIELKKNAHYDPNWVLNGEHTTDLRVEEGEDVDESFADYYKIIRSNASGRKQPRFRNEDGSDSLGTVIEKLIELELRGNMTPDQWATIGKLIEQFGK